MKPYIVISETEISNYIYTGLVELGYAPKEDETDDIAMLVFEYLIDLGIIDEFEEEE